MTQTTTSDISDTGWTIEKVSNFIKNLPTPQYTPIEDDITFLELVLEELDRSWTIGEMCTADGKKCLVGAAAFYSGADYSWIKPLNFLSLQEDERPSYLHNECYDLSIAVGEIEDKSAERLIRLLGEDALSGFLEMHTDPVDVITSFNDDIVDYSVALRPVLVETIEKLKEERSTGADD